MAFLQGNCLFVCVLTIQCLHNSVARVCATDGHAVWILGMDFLLLPHFVCWCFISSSNEDIRLVKIIFYVERSCSSYSYFSICKILSLLWATRSPFGSRHVCLHSTRRSQSWKSHFLPFLGFLSFFCSIFTCSRAEVHLGWWYYQLCTLEQIFLQSYS